MQQATSEAVCSPPKQTLHGCLFWMLQWWISCYRWGPLKICMCMILGVLNLHNNLSPPKKNNVSVKFNTHTQTNALSTKVQADWFQKCRKPSSIYSFINTCSTSAITADLNFVHWKMGKTWLQKEIKGYSKSCVPPKKELKPCFLNLFFFSPLGFLMFSTVKKTAYFPLSLPLSTVVFFLLF